MSRRSLLLVLAALAAACGGLRPSTDVPRLARPRYHVPPERPYDVDHYRIELAVLPAQRAVDGRCTIRLVTTEGPLDRIALDLAGLEVRGAADAAGRPLRWRHRGDRLELLLPEPAPAGELLELTVDYAGRPTTGLWFSGRRLDGSGPTQVFSQGQAEHNRGWFPCFDHPSDRATSELIVTVPADWIAVAPGERVELVLGDGFRREHWRMYTPHPSYLVSLVAGELVQVDDEWRGVPLHYLVEPRYEDWLEASFEETGRILSFLEDWTGVRYPYPKYSQALVANYPWGGMENISATTLTPLTLGDARSHKDRTSVQLVAHEAAHQWFGDLVTCDDWSHLWLNEGFASYMTLLYYEATRERDEFRALLRDSTDAYLAEDRGTRRRPTVSSLWRDPEDVFDTRAYQGGAARLHLLRFLVGDVAFRAGVRRFLTENAGRNVVTADLRAALEVASQQDLGTFFEQWIHAPGYPHLEFAWSWDARARRVQATVRQTQDFSSGTPRAYRLPVELEVRTPSGPVRHRVELERRVESFELPADAEPLYVRLDPDGWIPKALAWPGRTAREWIAIATHDEDVNGRRDAVRALGQLAGALERGAEGRAELAAELIERLANDTSRHVRADAATALGRILEGDAWAALQRAARADEDARVRTAALNSLAGCGPHAGLAAFGRAVFEEGYSWDTMGAAAALVASADPEGAPAWLVRNLDVDSPHDHLAGLLLAQLGRFETEEARAELEHRARDEWLHPTARAAAVRALALRPADRRAVNELLADLLDEESFRLRQAVVESLAVLGDSAARRTLLAYYPSARTANERRTIEAALAGPG